MLPRMALPSTEPRLLSSQYFTNEQQCDRTAVQVDTKWVACRW